MNWTEKQQRAIEDRNKNILVAAAAGSGKTAVLVERIKRLVLEERCPIDRMLIVTFTNAAASEMKEKIEKSIKDAITQVSGDDLTYLKKQLELMATANISTFHSFALEVIRRYFYIIDIEPNFKICDDVQGKLIKQEAFSILMEKLYEEGAEDFYAFLDNYSGDRKDDSFINTISALYSTIQSLPNPFGWLSDAVESINCDQEDFNDSRTMQLIWRETELLLADAFEACQKTIDYGNKIGHSGAVYIGMEDRTFISELMDLVKEKKYDEISRRIWNHRFTALSQKYKKPKDSTLTESELAEAEKLITYNREITKDIVKGCRDYFFGTISEQWKNIRDTYAHAKFLQRATIMYDEIFKELKNDKGMVDFNDIEHYALKILQDEQAASFYREKFKHIFIDEYQDSNIIQEALIETIKRENNLFMVGDIKQSIYKFRLAEPEIFQRKYALYRKENQEKGEDALSEKIDLNQNFRSKEKIIDFINNVFETTMEGYDSDAALYLGDPNGNKCPYNPLLYLVDESANSSGSGDDEIESLERTEREALATVKIIRDNLGRTIYDSKKNIERPIEMRDIVILMRAIRTQGDVFAKILTDNGIAAYVDDDTGFFDSFEVNTVVALLCILDNPKQEIPLITILRSEIFGFSIRELAEVKLNMKYGSFYGGFMAYANGKVGDMAIEGYSLNKDLVEKCKHAMETLENWRELSRVVPLNELIWSILIESEFYVVMGAMPAGGQRQANLRALVDKSMEYTRGQEGSLFGFIKYIEAIKSNKISMGQVKLLGEDDNTVRIMTIHKSKGLEFPMVILAGYCRKLNYTTVGKTIAIHKDVGIALRKTNHKEWWYKTTLSQNIIKSLIKKEEEAEEKRVLYVAMTRAIDMLYILGTSKNAEELLDKVSTKAPTTTDYFSMTGKRIFHDMGNVRIIGQNEIANVSGTAKENISRIVSLLTEKAGKDNTETDSMTEKIEHNLSYSYPRKEELNKKSKYSVSELNSQAHKNISLAEPVGFKLRDKFTPAQIGTITHKVLEKVNFSAASLLEDREVETYVHGLIREMIKEEFISEEEAKVVDAQSIEYFLRSSLGKRIGKSPHVVKEQTFNIRWVVEDRPAIVQGIIDCFFEEDGEVVLIDYKTSNLKSDEEFDTKANAIAQTYNTQISIYRKAIEEATGKKVKEAYLYLTNIGKTIKM